MRITDLLAMCFRNLFRRKVRTILTVLGVIIGTCSIVVMMSLGVGLNQNFNAQMESYMDVSVISVMPPTAEGQTGEKKVDLDEKAVEKFKKLDNVEIISPILNLMGVAQINTGHYNYTSDIIAMDLSTMKTFGYETTEGSLVDTAPPKNGIYFGYAAPYSFVDNNTGEIPNYEMDEEWHYVDDPAVKPMTDRFTIAPINNSQKNQTEGGESPQSGGNTPGITPDGEKSSSSDSAVLGQGTDLISLGALKEDYSKDGAAWGVVIPLELGQQLQKDYNSLNGIQASGSKYTSVKIKVSDMEKVAMVEEEIKAMGYQTESAEQFRDAMTKQANLIQLVLGGLGAISLFVAALGITNTMIMSIYERTREIGVMKVLGCSLKDIRMMFLIEAGAIGFIGGVLGIIFSYLISAVLNLVIGSMAGPDLAMKISIIPFWLILLGMGFAVGVGLIAGFSPANRAVKISPLSAIRQE